MRRQALAVFPERDSFELVLAKLVELVGEDVSFLEASRSRRILVSFTFPDLQIGFYTRLHEGSVEARIGAPAEESTIAVSMSSGAFDEVFSGRTNPAKAAIRGMLSFSGNVIAGMRFQSLFPSFVRLYKQACGESPEARGTSEPGFHL